MRAMTLNKAFFDRNSFLVAQELIGCSLCRKFSDQTTLKSTISEIEVYDGFNDQASHAFKGRTRRNSVMYGPAGRFYLYLCYGRHWMLNISTERKDYPAAILIRALSNCEGPGRLTKMLSIDGDFNNKPMGKQTGLWIEARTKENFRIKRSPRIGIAYAGSYWGSKPYRYSLELL